MSLSEKYVEEDYQHRNSLLKINISDISGILRPVIRAQELEV
jgi:hypothetical protein